MQNEKITLPLEIYYKHLTQINGVEFTPREVDVISCILNRRATSISAFLLIGPRAVETYNRNIRQKAGGLAGREQIIDFVEKSGKFSLIKNEYYFSLRLRVLFEEKLRAISKKFNIKSSCLLAFEKGQKYNPSLIPYLKEHLKYVGFEVKTCPTEGKAFFIHPNEIPNLEQINHILYIFPQGLYDSQISQINTSHLSNVTFLFHQNTVFEGVHKNLKNNNYINMLEKQNYYLSFFEILKKLLPHSNLESIAEEFKRQYELTNESSDFKNSQEGLKAQKEIPFPSTRKNFIKKRKWSLLIGLILSVSLLNLGFFIISRGIEKESSIAYSVVNQSDSLIRYDLMLPNETTLLNRLELMDQIDNKFKGQGGIQSIALVGIGGAGKTTLARRYARQQTRDVVWEMNAETNSTLMESFEKLAQVLSKTDQDKKVLREIQEIKNSIEREEKIIRFVKERLKLQSWFLIYDNVEKFSDIQRYFPQDMNTWGVGKIILTTRNNNIQSNNQVDGIILIGELTPNQKLSLFMQIMNHGEKYKLTATQQNEAREFLKQLPPFPLDISVAAYYLKTMNISYDKYLEYLNNQDKEFIVVQENLLKEVGEYTKTRYGIITLSLKQLMATHKDFAELLLFISTLDSQNIPRDLLDLYKGQSVVDNFIYYLKKYSLIMSNSSIPSADSALSIHRSTQAIALAYLTRTLDLEKNQEAINYIGNTIKNYTRNIIDKEDYSQMKLLVTHGEAFLSHDNLLTKIISGVINGELGYLYYNLSNYNRAEKSLKKSLLILEECASKNATLLFRPLSYLGIVYWGCGEFEKAKTLFEKSIKNYKKFKVEDDSGFCLTLTYLGLLYTDQNCLKKAQILLEDSLLIYQKARLKNYPGLSFTLMHLGNLYRKLGKYKEAKFYIEKSLFFYKKYLTDASPQAGWAFAHLGYVYESFGYFEKAKDFHERTLDIYKQHYPQNSLHIAWALRNLGTIYNEIGDLKKAKSLLEQSAITFKKSLGENNIKTQWALFHLAKLYRNMGHLEKAKNILKNCLMFYNKNYAKDNSSPNCILIELAKIHFMENNIEVAEVLLNKVLDIYKKRNHPYIYEILEDFADLYLNKSLDAINKGSVQQSYTFKNQAISNLKRSLEIVKTHFPVDSPHKERIELKLKELEQE